MLNRKVSKKALVNKISYKNSRLPHILSSLIFKQLLLHSIVYGELSKCQWWSLLQQTETSVLQKREIN